MTAGDGPMTQWETNEFLFPFHMQYMYIYTSTYVLVCVYMYGIIYVYVSMIYGAFPFAAVCGGDHLLGESALLWTYY